MPRKATAPAAAAAPAPAAAPPSSAAHALILRAFDDAQRSFASHPKHVAQMRAAFAADAQAFFEAFVAECSRVLLVYKREPAVERLVDFVAMFAEAAPGWNEEFAVGLLQLRAWPVSDFFLSV
jgi:hypothetical protein